MSKLRQELAATKLELRTTAKLANDNIELCNAIIDQRKKARDSYFVNYAKALKHDDAIYSQLMDFTVAKLESLLDCPLSMHQIKVPAILPCGKTVEKEFMEELIRRKKSDPFDRTQPCKTLVVNRLAQELQETLAIVSKKREELKEPTLKHIEYVEDLKTQVKNLRNENSELEAEIRNLRMDCSSQEQKVSLFSDLRISNQSGIR